MPTATSFTALGRGNGFPFCLETINVLDRGDGNAYDHWVTLGGFKKTDTGSPTQSQINTSLQKAMALFWNAHQINGLASLSSSYNVASVTNSRNPNTTQLQPSERICLSSAFYDNNAIYSSTEDESNEMRLNVIPVLLKSGNNFLGYGIKNKISAQAITFEDEFAEVGIGSIASTVFDRIYETIDYDYITLGGIDFVCKARVGSWAYPNATADASNLTAYGGTSSISHRAEIDSLDFYTY